MTEAWTGRSGESARRRDGTSAPTTPAHDAPLIEWARFYLLEGYAPIPVLEGKNPGYPDWPQLRLDESQLPAYFADPALNIGLLCGEPSTGRVDVDLDAPEAVAAAPLFLPPTGLRHGRPGKPESHPWYFTDPPPKTERWADPARSDNSKQQMLVELRSTGAQTIVPPSRHPDGEQLVWHQYGEPARVDGKELRVAVARVAACALLARRWPAEGARHHFALALSGFLLRGGLDLETATRLVEGAADIARDPQVGDRARAVRDTAAALAAGHPFKVGRRSPPCFPTAMPSFGASATGWTSA